MPSTEHQQSFLGRISIRQNQVNSVDACQEQELEDLGNFQKYVTDNFIGLLSDSSTDHMFSISWLNKLLDVFLWCEAEFKALLILARDSSHISKPPVDRLVHEFLDRMVRSMDICVAVSLGIDSLCSYISYAQTAVAALKHDPLGDGAVNRAKKALKDMHLIQMNEDQETNKKSIDRTWSIGRRAAASSMIRGNPHQLCRSNSLVVSKNWSAAKQIQAMCSGLLPPRGTEPSSLALSVHLMSIVTMMTMASMVACVPCQDRNSFSIPLQIPRHFPCAHVMSSLLDKIIEEWKKKEKRVSAGLLEEVAGSHKIGLCLADFAERFQFSVNAETPVEVTSQVAELEVICGNLETGLRMLKKKIRDVFHRLVDSKVEIRCLLEQSDKGSLLLT